MYCNRSINEVSYVPFECYCFFLILLSISFLCCVKLISNENVIKSKIMNELEDKKREKNDILNRNSRGEYG